MTQLRDATFDERELERHRRELIALGYLPLGSVHDAEDVVQETMLRAWRSLASYDAGRASVRTWLHRIATNACLRAMRQRVRGHTVFHDAELMARLGLPADPSSAA